MGAYEETLAWLSALEVSAGWDLKLERMRAAVARRGHPERRFPALHVAGTNGKGSTAAMLDAVLTAAGYRTGLYTSPHLVDFTERIRAGGRTIPRDAVVGLVAELRHDLEAAGIRLTHFEFATLLAFEWFARVGIDVGVIEVGLGGRLDATNVVEPLATAITSIGRDHEEYLGREIASIAAEKAGILKPGVPLALGRLPPEADAVVAARAAELGVPLARAGVDGRLEPGAGGFAFHGPGVTWEPLGLGLRGAFQQGNAAVALTTLALARQRLPCGPGAVRAGLAGVRWPGRLAVLRERPLVVLDGAHNPDGAEALARELPAVVGARSVILVLAVMADKDWRGIVAPVLPRVARVVLTRVGRRGADPALLAAELRDVAVEVVPEPRAAVARALAVAAPGDAVLVTGSLFLVGEAYATLAPGIALFEPWNGWKGDGTEAAL
jgi:dihydrofolate synthase / folylpolyglutamate synthase